MLKPKVYAYVKRENCIQEPAKLPGSLIGDKPISTHGDWVPWCHGKKETRKRLSGTSYSRYCAKAVIDLLGDSKRSGNYERKTRTVWSFFSLYDPEIGWELNSAVTDREEAMLMEAAYRANMRVPWKIKVLRESINDTTNDRHQ